MITNAHVVRIAADAAGLPPTSRVIPLPVSYLLAALGTARPGFAAATNG